MKKIFFLIWWGFVSTVHAQAPAIQWQNRIGGSGYNLTYSSQPTSDGGYIIGGYSNSPVSGDKTQANQGLADYWIVKTNGAGVVEWDQTIGGAS